MPKILSAVSAGLDAPTKNYVDDQNATDRAMLASTEASTTASATHLTGSYFILGGVLYQATADIAQGDAIETTGAEANCEAVTVGEELKSIRDGAIAAPSSPSSGQYLQWNGSAWVASSLPVYNGGAH